MKIKRFEFNMFPVNCYVLWDDTKEAVVIDPGCFYEEEKQALKKFILTNELNVKHLLNTHLHLDHIFGNPFMLKEFGLSAEANKADEYWIDEAPKQSRMFGFQLQEEPVPLGKYLHDGDIITFGHTKLEAIHVPGHSPVAVGVLLQGRQLHVLRRRPVSGQYRSCRSHRRQLR
ncbi:MBL fold metallo-hydrolase [Bacteroides xylanisolvens]|nr:MBL fold metallo-hydrolase [Bacteroides xylanisolvens]